MSYLKSFGKNLARIRKAKGFSQEHLAELIGLGHRSLSPVETGKNFLAFDKFEKLCDILDTPPYEFFMLSELPDNIEKDKYLSYITNGLKQLNEKELKTLGDLLFTYIEKNR